MYECIIAYRFKGGHVEVVRDPDNLQEVLVFPNKDAAVEFCETQKEFPGDEGYPGDYQIVELDEL